MTKRQGVFPPEGTEDGTFHWIEGGLRHRPQVCWLAGLSYLGPAPTYEQSRADAADARRFRFLLSMWGWKDDALRDLFYTNVEDDRIRAAIDAAMKEDSNA